MAKVIWDTDFPPEIRKIVEPHYEEFKFMIPEWLRTLYFSYVRESGNAQNSTKEEYRRSTISIAAAYIDQPRWKQREDILHEILHITTNAVYDEMFNLKNLASPDNKAMTEYIEEQVRTAIERTVSDLTFCIIDQLNSHIQV